MDQKPKIPTLKDTQKPQVRIKGLAARLSLVERLKQFKKKDLAFILAGLGVLFMAPLAEHFMMSPENADSGSGFKQGWSFSPNRFGDGSSPYESGVNGMAPGGLAGGGGDVITPLNVRDPSSLVMGPGSSQQPAATSVAPPPPAKENTDWKDAIANAASRGGSAATKAASLPVPKTSLTNAGLRGLGVAGGSSGASWNPPPISAANVPNKAAGSNSLGSVTKAPGYMGVGSRGPKAGAGGLEDLKKMAERAGSVANRQGSAATSLETAAGMGKGTGDGTGGAGQGMSAKDDKGGSGNSGKDSKSLGESLAFLAAKAHQQKAIDLYWKMKEKDAMLWPNLKEKMLEEAVMTPFKALTKGVSGMFEDFGSDKNSKYYMCKDLQGKDKKFSGSTPPCNTDMKSGICFDKPSGNMINMLTKEKVAVSCEEKSGSADSAPNTAEQLPANQQIDGTGNMGGVQKLDDVCSSLTNSAATDAAFGNVKDKMIKATGSLYVVRQAIWGTQATCGNVSAPAEVTALGGTIKSAMAEALQPILMAQPDQQAAGTKAEPGAFTLDLVEMDKGVKALADLSVDEANHKATAGGKWDAKSAYPDKYTIAREKMNAVGSALAKLDTMMTTDIGSNIPGADVSFPKGSDAPNHVSSLTSHKKEYILTLSDVRVQYQELSAALDSYNQTYPINFQTLVANAAAFVSTTEAEPKLGDLTLKTEGAAEKPAKVYSVGSWNKDASAKKDALVATRDFLVKQNGSPEGGLAKWVADQGEYLSKQISLCPPKAGQ